MALDYEKMYKDNKDNMIDDIYKEYENEFNNYEKLAKSEISDYLEKNKEYIKRDLRYYTIKRITQDYKNKIFFKDTYDKIINEIKIINKIIKYFKINNNDFKIYYKYIIKDFQKKLDEIFEKEEVKDIILSVKSIDNKIKDILTDYENNLDKLINDKCNDNKNDFNDIYNKENIIDITQNFYNINKKLNIINENEIKKLNTLIILFYNSEIYNKKNILKISIKDFLKLLEYKLDIVEYNYYNELFNKILDKLKDYKDEWYCPNGKIEINDNVFYGGIMLFDFKIFIFVILIILIIIFIIVIIIKIKK